MAKARRYQRTIAKHEASIDALKRQIEERDASRQRPVLQAQVKELQDRLKRSMEECSLLRVERVELLSRCADD